ncbi:MAG: hypothetical protein PUF24_08365 [Oribacterium sp.]|nr:hypothetical protein [Oribacterium sp.]MDD6520167.1 hypothetical protein [Oribacterium sp.]MDY2855030.1 hypothetical protein [Oliverpabstia sp.]
MTGVALVLLLLFGLFINRHLSIRALYGDDLYLWSFYGCEDFWSFTFPKVTKGNFRPFYWALSYLEFRLIGPHVHWYARFNVLLNVAIAWVIYFFSRRLSRLTRTPQGMRIGQAVGLLTGMLYLQSHFAAYQIAQVLGLLESLALLLALLTLWGLFDYMEGRGTRAYLRACLCFFLVIFTHERYIALAPLFYLAVLTQYLTERRLCRRFAPSRSSCAASDEIPAMNRLGRTVELLLPLLILAVFFGTRMVVAGEAIPVGTAGTKVQDTFSLAEALGFAFSQVAYIFGINAGHAIFCGVSFADSARWVQGLIVLSWLCLLLMLVLYVRMAWKRGRITPRLIGENLLFICFIALCIGSSSITIRLETRWVYVSYTAALLYLSYMLGEIAKSGAVKAKAGRAVRTRAATVQRASAASVSASGERAACRGMAMVLAFSLLFMAYGAVMTPVEHYDRQHYPNIFFFFDQDRVNSLADCTIDAVGAGEFLGKKQVYIYYNYYEMSDFYAEYFYKPFDPEKTGQGTEIHFINRPDELPADATVENSVVLMEHGNRSYIDVTAQTFGLAAWEALPQT